MKKQCTPPCQCKCPWTMGKRMTKDEYITFKLDLYQPQGTHGHLIKDMVVLIGQGLFTVFYFANGSTIETSLPISHYATILPSGHFGQYCKWAIINLEYVKDYTTKGNWEAEMTLPNSKSAINRECRCRFMRDYDKYGH